jgi:hypothetical protein
VSVLPKIIGVLSAISGAGGTGLLYKGSFAYEQFSHYASRASVAEMSQRNRKRHRLQRAGLLLIMISFVLAGISVLLG